MFLALILIVPGVWKEFIYGHSIPYTEKAFFLLLPRIQKLLDSVFEKPHYVYI